MNVRELDLWEEYNRYALESGLLGVALNSRIDRLIDKIFHNSKRANRIKELEKKRHEIWVRLFVE